MAGTAPKKKPKDVAALIAGRRRAERTVPICMRADLRREIGRLSTALVDAEAVRKTSGSLASGSVSRDLAEQIDALHQEMVDATVNFGLRAMKRREWRDLALAHPPREGVDADLMYTVNEDTFFAVAIRRSCFEPELTDDVWAELMDEFSDAEWGALRDAVTALNRDDVDVPFSRLGSRILQDSAIS